MPYFTLAYFIGVLAELFLSRLLGKAQKSTLKLASCEAEDFLQFCKKFIVIIL